MNIEELISELKNNKDNIDIATSILNEINTKLENNEIEFQNKHTEEIYTYMLYSNKLGISKTLDKLINTPEFIKTIDNTNIDGSVLPSLTNICTKPRTCLLKNSRKLKESILRGGTLISTEEILSDLTQDEIRILREDIEIDNYLISKGISFSTIKDDTIKRLLSDANIFNLYSINTISEFANAYNDKEELLNNDIFLTIYLDKLNDEYHYVNGLFQALDIPKTQSILSKRDDKHILLHLLKDTKKEVQEYLLKSKELLKTLSDITDEAIISKLPKETIVKLLSKRDNLLNGSNFKILEKLSKKDLEKIFTENVSLYKDLVDELLKETEKNLVFLVNALPVKELKDFCENKLAQFDLKTLNKLLKTENEELRKAILKNAEISTSIINRATTKTFNLLEDVLKAGRYTGEEVVKILNNMTDVKDTKVLNKLIELVPLSLRKDIYNNNVVRENILKEETYELDDYSINHLLNNIDELKNQSARVITDILRNSDIDLAREVLDDENVLEKIFKEPKSIDALINILVSKKNLLQLLSNPKIIKYYDLANIKEIFKYLDANEKINLMSNDLLKRILNNNEEAFELYKKLFNKNKYLLETINFEFLGIPNLTEVKLSTLEIITKYPSLQEDILVINKSLNIIPNFLNLLIYNNNKLSIENEIARCLTVLRESAEGINRKVIGNIPKMINNYGKELTKDNYKSLITYLLYQIPRYYKANEERVARPIKLETPSSFNEIIDYEKNTEFLFTQLINEGPIEDVKKYFVAKHFKLTPAEATIMLNTYSIDRIDEKIYKDEYQVLSNLNKIMNTDPESLKEMDSKYEILSMYDSFVIEKQIKKMYGKIYNFEIRSKTYSNQPFTKELYGKEVQILSCPNDFLFLTSNLDINDELLITNSYLEAWHNTLNKHNNLRTSLISNDKFTIDNELVFGFNGLLDTGIVRLSNIKVCPDCNNITKEKYMTPRELIDNTRDINNSVVIDKYAIRPNYNNSNIPNIEPDFILVDINKIEDNQYLEKAIRASEEFKTKRNKKGLPIIAYDIEKIAKNELAKINSLIKKYIKNYDMNMLHSILTRLQNNYTSYRNTYSHIAEKFNINELLTIVYERINKTNSIAELEYIEELFTREYHKFNNVDKELCCNFDIKELREKIKERISFLNK